VGVLLLGGAGACVRLVDSGLRESGWGECGL